MSPHYGALRDGNLSTIPSSYLGAKYRTPSFRVATEVQGEGTAERSK